MTEKEEQPKEVRTKLHIFRVRARGEADFYDPQTDIRKLLPYIGIMVIEDLKVVYKDDARAQFDLSYLWNCLNVFRIRVSEDNTPLTEQMLRFVEAINQVNPEILHQFTTSVFVMFTVVYAVYQRRDIQIDGPGQAQMLATARLADFMELLPPEFAEKLHKYVQSNPMFKEQIKSVDPRSSAQVAKDGKVVDVFHNLKERARLFLPADGDQSWEALAEACDQCFQMLPEDAPVQTKAALCLAYPDYKYPTQCEFDEATENYPERQDSPSA